MVEWYFVTIAVSFACELGFSPNVVGMVCCEALKMKVGADFSLFFPR